MLQKSEVIVLKKTPFKDSSAIVHTYSPDWGFCSFIVHGIKKSPIKAATFQHLNIVELDAYIKGGSTLYTVKESKIQFAFEYTHLQQSDTLNMGMFVNELFYNISRNSGADPSLYQCMKKGIMSLHSNLISLAHYPIMLCIELSHVLGFSIQSNGLNPRFFDLKNGSFVSHPPLHPLFLDETQSSYLLEYLSTTAKENPYPTISYHARKLLLNQLCQYLELHIEGFGKMQSLAILAELTQD